LIEYKHAFPLLFVFYQLEILLALYLGSKQDAATDIRKQQS
jgi:hypothetical protein